MASRPAAAASPAEHITLAFNKDLWIDSVEPTRQLSATSGFAEESRSTPAGFRKSEMSTKDVDLDEVAAAAAKSVVSAAKIAPAKSTASSSKLAPVKSTATVSSSKLAPAYGIPSTRSAPPAPLAPAISVVHYEWIWFYRPDATATIDVRACFAEFIAMFLFVVIGCGTACSQGSILIICLAFGLAITVLAYSVGHHSGGQINCAVTLSLVLSGKLCWKQGAANVVCQLLGSLFAALLLAAIFPCEVDKTGTLGTNFVAEGYTTAAAFVAEVFGTFLLCFVVYETAAHPRASAGNVAALAIGLSVFLAHALLVPITGCSINPTRSFGPAVVSALRDCSDNYMRGLEDLWIFVLAPSVGAALAAGCQRILSDTPFEREEI
eukprot:CAMPEP_0206468936 /NCGR_PEP_ID=MMETSP0324_2-20121206/29953_1 /ASSEMBLY_ACC=CAM_ASM_000836 /TAXON_ID=2866 /ORGANISM="Crypthecodinium cohnii, Strain Seligo" /LENGTH=378 /DNA_ID=CAMNT_0053942543 /DNA_START=84 /DNA_END=1219 /DNA_ORIENTATION=+